MGITKENIEVVGESTEIEVPINSRRAAIKEIRILYIEHFREI
jgi:hypothetical protein